MEAFLEDLEHSGERHRPEKFSDFKRVLAEIEKHPNRRFFILKSIIVNNLYGVDIMEEAVEICKLRLFLKLVAQVDRVKDLEPLPDIDFNIRPGNTLVGFARLNDVKRTLDGKLGFKKGEVDRITEDAEIVDRAYRRFHEMQTAHDMDSRDFVDAKIELRSRLSDLTEQLDRYLATEYGINEINIPDNKQCEDKFQHWCKTHQPFHWFAEFYGIMRFGGFDIAIGNPPYVEVSKVSGQYTFQMLELADTGNLFSVCMERFVKLCNSTSRVGIILPISAVSTPRMLRLMDMAASHIDPFYVSNYAVRPGKLFVGADMNLCILLGGIFHSRKENGHNIFSTAYRRWRSEFREYLFPSLSYSSSFFDKKLAAIPKWGTKVEKSVAEKLAAFPSLVGGRTKGGSDIIYYHSGGRYFRKCIKERLSNEYKELILPEGYGEAAICLMSSSLFYWLWISYSDCYHVTKWDLKYVPIHKELLNDKELNYLSVSLLKDMWSNAKIRERSRADGSIQKEVNFNVGKSKLIIDKIDTKLAEIFGLTAEQTDFIINFDISYRIMDSD
jgi:hypothetical protein